MREIEIPSITFAELLELHSVILFDAYGVLAGSDSILPHAPAAIEWLRSHSRAYFVLTNDASALPETRAERYRQMGLSIPAERIITSGSLLERYFYDSGLTGARCVVLGTADSVRYVEDAGGVVVGYEDEFDALIIGDQSGFPFLSATDSALSTMFRMIDAGNPPRLVLPNPDLIYPEGDGFGFASGTVAQMFESALDLRYPDRHELRFERLGKPHPAMFWEALRRSGSMDMAMIGDQLGTDIKGANDFGIASVLVETGISSADSSSSSDTPRPTYRMGSLAL